MVPPNDHPLGARPGGILGPSPDHPGLILGTPVVGEAYMIWAVFQICNIRNTPTNAHFRGPLKLMSGSVGTKVDFENTI